MLMEHGENGRQNGYFTDVQFEDLKTKMLKSDRRALTEEGFWKDELEMIMDRRTQYMNS